MPQLDLMTLMTQVVWLLWFLLVVYGFLVSKGGLIHRISKVLKLRKKVLRRV